MLRGLNSGSVDLIYLDPPFNSGRQWSAPIGSEAAGASFKDAWTLSDVDLAWHGEIAERHPALYAILDAAGEAHGKPMKSYLIYMGVRLMEMRRVLAPTGSIYLHCDDTAGAYLKMTMDAVFGADNYRNEITWKRSTVKGSRGARKTLGKDVDSILFYSRTGKTAFRVPKAKPANMPKFPHTDGVGNYRPVTRLIAEAGLHDCPKYEWRGLNPEYGWRVSKPNLEALYAEGRIHWNSKGKPFRKQYDFEYEGVDVGSLWADIPFLAPQAKERIGYPTQKPLALLERIVAASSNEGDMVLDPFCGCATACVAAEKLGREWAGIDISPKAAELVRSRLRGELGLFYRGAHRTDVPARTDLGDIPPYNADVNKRTLYGEQEGVCNGCRLLFPYRNLTIDHVVPQSRGGGDELGNLQLLCAACNSAKGSGTHEALIAKLVDEGIRA